MSAGTKKLNVHFIGIGGVSMSSLANYLIEMGFNVSGSDIMPSLYTERLAEKGCKIYIGHSEKNIDGAQVIVYNSAIGEENAELKAARENKLFILSRAELLKMVSENFKTSIGVCGCNGKTTVTCMLAHIFKRANARFTAHIGGYDNSLTNSYVSGSEYFISEVCEYKKNIAQFKATVGVCLNTGEDHLECYTDKDELIGCYFNFLKQAETAVVFAEDENLKNYKNKNAVTFGYGENCDYAIGKVVSKRGKYSFDLKLKSGETIRINLNVYGRHNVINAAAAAAAAAECNISPHAIKRGIESFNGTMRRFEKIGSVSGSVIIADYAHHPEEITAALSTADEVCGGELYVIFQPHTYTRTLLLKDEFASALSGVKNLVIYKTFAAREEYIAGGSAYELYNAMGKRGVYISDADALIEYIKSKAKRGDTFLVLGAGDLYDLLKRRLKK